MISAVQKSNTATHPGHGGTPIDDPVGDDRKNCQHCR
jgi:hypothetical protein